MFMLGVTRGICTFGFELALFCIKDLICKALSINIDGISNSYLVKLPSPCYRPSQLFQGVNSKASDLISRTSFGGIMMFSMNRGQVRSALPKISTFPRVSDILARI